MDMDNGIPSGLINHLDWFWLKNPATKLLRQLVSQ